MSDIEIEKICDEYGILNYTIKDGLVNVDRDVDLKNNKLIELTELPIKFGQVSGDFSIHNNKLTTLEGSPTYVGGDFFCGHNYLTDFKGCPDEVEGNFYCHMNNIFSLDGLLFKRIVIDNIYDNPIFHLYCKYKWNDIDHREFLIEADVIRPPDEIGGLPIINKDRMDWFTQTYGLEEFVGDKNYKIQL